MRVNHLPQQFWVVGKDPQTQTRYRRLSHLIRENPGDRVEVTRFEEVPPQPLRRKFGNVVGPAAIGGFAAFIAGSAHGLEGTALKVAVAAAATATGLLGVSMVRAQERPVAEERGRILREHGGYLYQQRLDGLIPRYGAPYYLPEVGRGHHRGQALAAEPPLGT